jgi:multicomponent Na+:H+ antiporter subunit G
MNFDVGASVHLAGLASDLLLIAGALFFLAGTIGLLRFPDVYSRLHALSKVDNVGLGLTVLGLMLRADHLTGALKLLLVWLLAMAAGATVSILIARRARRRGIAVWQAPPGSP